MKPAQQRRYVQFLQAIYVVFGLLIALLIVSVLLMALAANPCAALTSLDYGATTLLVAPFQGIIATPTSSSSAVLEFSSVVATFVYALMAWVIVRLIVILLPRRHSDVGVVELVGELRASDQCLSSGRGARHVDVAAGR